MKKLERKEMKNLKGGLFAEGGATCSTGSCQLVVQDNTGGPNNPSFVTYHGTCASTSAGICYCNTAYYNTTGPLSSNGGISRCTIS